jgi:hypothetical protein
MQESAQSNRSMVAGNGEEAKEITITIAYDQKRAGGRAAQLFSLIGQEQKGQLRIAIQLWRFDLLADPDWRNFAAAEALQADILVIAMCKPTSLSAAVEQWFTMWLDAKRGFHAAVIALVEGESEADSSDLPELHFLESATKEAGLDFFTPRPDYLDQTWKVSCVPPQAFSFGKPYRHCGING